MQSLAKCFTFEYVNQNSFATRLRQGPALSAGIHIEKGSNDLIKPLLRKPEPRKSAPLEYANFNIRKIKRDLYIHF